MKISQTYKIKTAPCYKGSSLKVFKPIHRNTYLVTVTHMHGDADHYTTDESPFETESEMLDYVNFMLRCMYHRPNGRGGEYRDVEGYDEYDEYLYHNDTSYDSYAIPDKIEVAYYDADGTKWDVKLTK